LALTFLITGASRGIGRALTDAAAARGDRVIAAVRDVGSVSFPARVSVVAMDVASTASVRAARATIGEPIDVIVNNAGISGGPQWAPGMDLDRAERIIQVDELGPLRVYDAFADLLRKARGKLVNVSSEAGSLSSFRASGKPEYAMAKAGLNALTRWVGAKDADVLAVSLHPGWTRTATGGDEAPQSPEQAAEKLLSAIERLGEAHRGGFFDTDLSLIPW